MTVVCSDKKQTGQFKCSDPVLQRIWDAGVNTLDSITHDQHIDDIRVRSLADFYVFGNTSFASEALCSADTDRGLVWVMMLKDYSDYTASSSILEKLFPDLKLLMDERYLTQENEHGLIASRNVLDNMFYCKALTDASELAARAREFQSAEAWRERAKRVKNAINERLWDDGNGIYVDCRAGDKLIGSANEYANYIGILFDVADESQVRRILKYLDSHESADATIDFYVLEALAKAGRHQQALDIIRQTDEGPASVCWLMRHIAGIQLPDATSRLPYTVDPQLCDLKWVKAKVGSVRSMIARSSSGHQS